MTNGEKFKEVFGISQVDEGELYAYAWLPNHDAAEFCIDWWNAEYKEPVIRDNGVKDELNRVKNELEPTTKNDKVDCEHTDCNNCVNHKYCDYEYKESSTKVNQDLIKNKSEIPTGSTTKSGISSQLPTT